MNPLSNNQLYILRALWSAGGVDCAIEDFQHFLSGMDRGGIIGSVEIVDCVTESKSPWFFGRYGFVLRNPVALPFRPFKGMLGFFDVPELPEASNSVLDGSARPQQPLGGGDEGGAR